MQQGILTQLQFPWRPNGERQVVTHECPILPLACQVGLLIKTTSTPLFDVCGCVSVGVCYCSPPPSIAKAWSTLQS